MATPLGRFLRNIGQRASAGEDLPQATAPGEVWLTTGAEPRPRDRRAEALQLFVPGGLVLAAATALGLTMLTLSGSDSQFETVAQRDARPEPAAGRGMQVSDRPEAPAAQQGFAPVSGAPSGSASPTPSSSPTELRLPVVVLDDSGDDSGGTVANVLRSGGWAITQVSDYDARVRQSTVYYPKGRHAEGRAVAKALPGEQRVKVQQGNLKTAAVVVVVTDDYRS